jgi:predicted nucleic acid-binding Zn ribbon protein
MYRCNACGEWVEKHLLFCPDCRAPITPLDAHQRFRRSDLQMAALVALAMVAVILIAIWAAS